MALQRKFILLLLLMTGFALSSCRSVKCGCPMSENNKPLQESPEDSFLQGPDHFKVTLL
jgi:hypothetical protein